ncbi:CBF/Mak21 family-domain-containing protein [Bisporella sp. PMI_857]|nr:CBF/Mak21 family-domain-containing protein [Bisporella sp. PMI_857]
MAKHKKPPEKVHNGPLKRVQTGLPTFDEKTLSALTEQIEKSLDKGKAPGKSTQTPNRNKNENKANSSNSATKHGSKVTENSENIRGTKRDAQGNAKNLQSRGKGKQKSEHAEDDRVTLLQEILALGGTEEDLDLVNNEGSRDEEDLITESSKSIDKSLQRELAKFAASLGINGQAEVDASESEEESKDDAIDSEDGGEWEEVSDEDLSAEIIDSAPAATSKPVKDAVPANHTSDKSLKDQNRLVFDARPDWHVTQLPDLPNSALKDSSPFQNAIASLKAYATSLLEADSNLYASKHLSASSSHRFLSTIMTSGTLSDKVSALTLVVQESPVHTTKSFESLLSLAKKRSRGQAVTALGALKDLLGVGVVLPADRRLRTFATQPGLLGTLEENMVSMWNSGLELPGQITKAHLISWAYEDWLKEQYFEMLKILEGWCNDEVEYARSRAVTYVYELLESKPEQESNLLRLLVNKLGDPDKKIASRTSYLLLQLQTKHPLMKPIIVRSIETELLLRPNQSSHARYYAINTLNQTILSGKEEQVAQSLLDIYFQLFVTLLKKPDPLKAQVGPKTNRKGQIQGGGAPMGKKALSKATKEEEAKLTSEETTEKMISAVLTGVNRAFPFSKTNDNTLERHMDTLFKITHSSNFNTSIQALMLIEQLSTTKHLATDRFYRTLYESLLDPRLVTSSKHALYLNLLFRALRSDLNIKRVKAFAKRLLQIITLHQPPFICGVLYLIRELEVTFPGLKTLFNEPEFDDEDEQEVIRDVPEDGGEAPFSINQESASQTYDGRKRDPEHSNADKSCLWESLPFLAHFHPSVSMFADRLLSGEKMPPKPDLASHTLAHFLDRFVYRNAKTSTSGLRGSSIMQPLSGGDSKGILLSNRTTQNGQTPLNSEAFWRKKVEDVAVDEIFFHKYFSQIGKGKQIPKKKVAKAATGSDHEEDDNEDEIWQALVDSKPEVEGPSDDDSDLEMLNLDDSDASSDGEDGGVDIEGSDDEVDVEGSDDGFLDAVEDTDALVDTDEDAGSTINELFEKELEKGVDVEEKEETTRQKRRRLKNLPTFASVDDYAAMLDNDDDEDI